MPDGAIECDTADEALDLQRRLARGQTQSAPVGAELNTNGSVSRRRYRRTGAGQSIRARVLGIIGQEWTTAEETAKQASLEVKQVRGVLNAADLRDKIDNRVHNGAVQYRLRQES